MKSKALYVLMAAAVALTFVTLETVSVRLGHALAPMKLETVNRFAKSGSLLERAAVISVARNTKTALLSVTSQDFERLSLANRTAKADRFPTPAYTQKVARTGKTARLAQVAALPSRAPMERANRLAKAGRLTKAAADQFVARSLKTDSLKLIFAALTSAGQPAKTAVNIVPAPMVIDNGVSAQGGPLVFVPVNVSLARSTNVAVEPLDANVRAETL